MTRRRVLYVEDERLLAEAVCDVLGDDHDVEHAATVAQAKKMIRERSYDVMLCDVALPDGSATDVCAAWPADRAHHVVIVTGGAAHHPGYRVLGKPFDVTKLAALVDLVAALQSSS